ncbi:hypothetical protein [Spirosoma endbachense]|uniref:Uncharacterized protein n=1 Tax=Spirosoma endbachense TaxID=2666025 RepID=A0A6P1W8F0_9BACT|nr:hypothetical protein [Spirosoma endbachense]QHW00191.1 hypothetical protein GJR95_36520 [Spirosoma endbachense]
MVLEAVTFNPTVTLPDEAGDQGPIQYYLVWASIPANDDKGIVIDNVLEGDEIEVYNTAGIASFDKVSMEPIKGIVGIINVVAGGAVVLAEPEMAPLVAGFTAGVEAIIDAIPDELGTARRTAYGLDPGTGDYAKNEGGLIVCMPESSGAIYATDDYHLTGDTKNEGRLYKYYSDDTKNVNAFFPCPVVNDTNDPTSPNNGRMSATSGKPGRGAINILAFDERFDDNAGYYNVGIIITRHSNIDQDVQLKEQLLEAVPNTIF